MELLATLLFPPWLTVSLQIVWGNKCFLPWADLVRYSTATRKVNITVAFQATVELLSKVSTPFYVLPDIVLELLFLCCLASTGFQLIPVRAHCHPVVWLVFVWQAVKFHIFSWTYQLAALVTLCCCDKTPWSKPTLRNSLLWPTFQSLSYLPSCEIFSLVWELWNGWPLFRFLNSFYSWNGTTYYSSWCALRAPTKKVELGVEVMILCYLWPHLWPIPSSSSANSPAMINQTEWFN